MRSGGGRYRIRMDGRRWRDRSWGKSGLEELLHGIVLLREFLLAGLHIMLTGLHVVRSRGKFLDPLHHHRQDVNGCGLLVVAVHRPLQLVLTVTDVVWVWMRRVVIVGHLV